MLTAIIPVYGDEERSVEYIALAVAFIAVLYFLDKNRKFGTAFRTLAVGAAAAVALGVCVWGYSWFHEKRSEHHEPAPSGNPEGVTVDSAPAGEVYIDPNSIRPLAANGDAVGNEFYSVSSTSHKRLKAICYDESTGMSEKAAAYPGSFVICPDGSFLMQEPE